MCDPLFSDRMSTRSEHSNKSEGSRVGSPTRWSPTPSDAKRSHRSRTPSAMSKRSSAESYRLAGPNLPLSWLRLYWITPDFFLLDQLRFVLEVTVFYICLHLNFLMFLQCSMRCFCSGLWEDNPIMWCLGKVGGPITNHTKVGLPVLDQPLGVTEKVRGPKGLTAVIEKVRGPKDPDTVNTQDTVTGEWCKT